MGRSFFRLSFLLLTSEDPTADILPFVHSIMRTNILCILLAAHVCCVASFVTWRQFDSSRRPSPASIIGFEHGRRFATSALCVKPRRQFFCSVASAASCGLLLPDARALELAPASASLPAGLLESRVTGNVLAPPPYGMEGTDIFYPTWFTGTWKVSSETTEVQAPCGVALFGGNSTYKNALKDVGNTLTYDSRFVRDTSGRVIADREYNVKSIAREAMGENSVVDVSSATPNKFSCTLAPKGSPSMLSVDLIVLNRRQEPVSETRFDCSEVVREIASPVDRPKQVSAILKEIETTSLYVYDPIKDVVRCRQRSAAFLLPSNESPMAMRMWQASGGKAIDVRYYDVIYSRY